MTLPPATTPAEQARLAALHTYLDPGGPPPAELDAVVRLAAHVAGVPTATVNVLDDRLQRQLATVGSCPQDRPRRDSMCSTTLGLGGFVHVRDAAQDPRFSSGPYVDGRLDRVRFYAAAPLVTPDGHALGTLCVYDGQPKELTAEQVAGLLRLAAVAMALFDGQRQRRREAERALEVLRARHAAVVAHDLQEGLLPHSLPASDRVRTASRYLPAPTGAEVGGDWYDAVRLDGRTVFAIGDVQGHNSRAAALMGQLRTAVRAYVSEGHSPAAALERTNQLLLGLGSELFATCCLVELDEQTGEACVASAGHPPPFVVDAAGVRALDVDPGPPLGVDAGAQFPASPHALGGRSRLVLYTDGVVEGPGWSLTDGMAALGATLRACADSGCEELADRVLAPVLPMRNDDVALLVVDYAGPLSACREARLQLPEQRAARAARAHLRATLDVWGLPEVCETAELVVSELVTNAVVHTGAPPLLTLRHDPATARLAVGVADASTRHPSPGALDEDALSGRGIRIVEALAERWWVSPRGTGKTVWAEVAAA